MDDSSSSASSSSSSGPVVHVVDQEDILQLLPGKLEQTIRALTVVGSQEYETDDDDDDEEEEEEEEENQSTGSEEEEEEEEEEGKEEENIKPTHSSNGNINTESSEDDESSEEDESGEEDEDDYLAEGSELSDDHDLGDVVDENELDDGQEHDDDSKDSDFEDGEKTKTAKGRKKTKKSSKNTKNNKKKKPKDLSTCLTKNPIILYILSQYVWSRDNDKPHITKITTKAKANQYNNNDKRMEEHLAAAAAKLGFVTTKIVNKSGTHAPIHYVRGEEKYEKHGVKRILKKTMKNLIDDPTTYVVKVDTYVYIDERDVSTGRLLKYYTKFMYADQNVQQKFTSVRFRTQEEARWNLDLLIMEAKEIVKDHRTAFEAVLADEDVHFASEEEFEDAVAIAEWKQGLDASTRDDFTRKGRRGHDVRYKLTEGDKLAIKTLSEAPDPTPVNPMDNVNKKTGKPLPPEPKEEELKGVTVKEAIKTIKDSLNETFNLVEGYKQEPAKHLLLKKLEEEAERLEESTMTQSSLQSKVTSLVVGTIQTLLDALPKNERGFMLDMTAEECLKDNTMEKLVNSWTNHSGWEQKDKNYNRRTAETTLQIAFVCVEARTFMGLCDGSIKPVKRDDGHTALWLKIPAFLIRYICIGQMRRLGLTSRLSVAHPEYQYFVDASNGDIVKYDAEEDDESRRFYLVRPTLTDNSGYADEEDEMVLGGTRLRIWLGKAGMVYQHHAMMYALDPYSDLFDLAQRFSVFRGYTSKKKGFYKPKICGDDIWKDAGLDEDDNLYKACQTDIEHELGYMFNCLWCMWRCHHTVNSWLHHIRAAEGDWLHPLKFKMRYEDCNGIPPYWKNLPVSLVGQVYPDLRENIVEKK